MKTNLTSVKRISTLTFRIFFGLAIVSHCPIAFAQCPTSTLPSSNPPNSIVRVQILSVEPNSDMEGDDDYVPFYDNHADIFGEITIDGQVFNLPQIEDSDFPHWNNVFEKQVTSSPAKITIKIFEDDSGLTGDNDVVDVNPSPGSKFLDLEFDLCALLLRLGSNQFSTQGIVEIDAGNGDEQATIRLKVETADGRPVTSNDLAIVEADIVQVLFQSPKLVSGKPTIVLVRIANNYSTSITTNIHVVVSGGGLNKNDVFPVTIGAGEVKKEYFYLNDPLRFPSSASSYGVALLVRIDDLNNQNLPVGDCKRQNDGNTNRLVWKTVHTPRRYSLMWTKVGTLLDGFNFVPDGQLQENMDLGGAYIHGVFPLSGPSNYKAPFDVLPPLSAAVDFLTTILSVFGIPADNVIPFALVFELNGVANVAGCDRLMGVLPNKDWFSRFSYSFFDEVTGLSLGEFAPKAVIFLPQHKSGSDIGPCMTLPAHELGHTFGLSTDPTLKDSWVCDVDWPILGSTACGIVGGFDEYKSDNFPNGNPSDGFWIAQGNEPAAIAGLLNQEQCGSFCLMGGSPANAHLNWAGKKRWIDPADYDHLVTKLQKAPDPEVIYVSGIISWDDKLHLGSIQHKGNGIADRDTSYGAYAIRFFDQAGKLLKEVGIPVYWSSPEFSARPRPVTFFGLNVVYPENARQLQVINRMSAKVLGSVNISARKPSIGLKGLSKSTIARGGNIRLQWSARDPDGDKLLYFTLARSARDDNWFPVEYWQGKQSTTISTQPLEPGPYRIKVMASDGVHVSESNEAGFDVTNR
jgi:hypothetical protein